MTVPLRRLSFSLNNGLRPTIVQASRSFSSDALMEVKPGEIGMVSGIPEEHLKRRVVIYSPHRTATQQGSGKVGRWKINFVSTQKWENPLMGWTSTGDPYANVGDSALNFDSEAAAKDFAERHGWDYVVRTNNPWAHTMAQKPCAQGKLTRQALHVVKSPPSAISKDRIVGMA